MAHPERSRMSSEDLPIPRPPHTAYTANKDQILVDEAALETFPASDPPAWTPTHAGSPSHEPVKTETPRELRARLRDDVQRLVLAERAERLEYVTSALLEAGRHVVRIPLAHHGDRGGPDVELLEAVIRGVDDGDELVIGADYDTNASATAVLLGLARVLSGRRFARTVRLIAFAAGKHGSDAYAKRLHEEDVPLRGMLSLDSVGFFTDRHETGSLASQLVPSWNGGSFVAFVGDRRSRDFVEEARHAFSLGTALEARASMLPSVMPLVATSDLRSFVHEGFLAALVTDTGPWRNRHPPSEQDVAALLNYDAMADVVFGLASVAARLVGGAAT